MSRRPEPVPLFDLTRSWPAQRDDALAAFERVAAAGAFSLGPELEAFEDEFAAYCQTRHAVGVANGTAAVELALRALGVGHGDEVVTTAHTFVATVEAIAATGATPVLIDIDPVTRCLDPGALERAVGVRTAAVVAVHLYGRPAEMGAIGELCDAAAVPVVEDAAQAHGATSDGRRTGSLGAVGCFSFYPTKNLGAMGDGGAVTTDDETLAAMVRSLRHHGSAPDDANRHERPGRTERLDSLQAALLRGRLVRLDADNEARRAAADGYRERLAGVEGIELPMRDGPSERSVHHLFVVEIDDRDAVRAHLAEQRVFAGVHYPVPVHLQPGWAYLGYVAGDLPNCERAARRVLSLPCFPGITESELDRVAATLVAAVGGRVG